MTGSGAGSYAVRSCDRGEVLPLVGDALGQPLPGAVVARRRLEGSTDASERLFVSAVARRTGSLAPTGHRLVIRAAAGPAVRRLRVPPAEQAGRGEHVVVVDHDPRALGQLPAALDVSPVLPPSTRSASRAGVPQHATRADEQADLAQVLAGAFDHAAVGAEDHLAPSGVPAQRDADRGRRDALVLVVLGVGRREVARVGVPRARPRRPGRRARAGRDREVAAQRMPRSPSTVRVTGRRRDDLANSASSGSSSTTEWTSVVAPPTSTTTTSPGPVLASSREQLDAGQHDVRRRAR